MTWAIRSCALAAGAAALLSAQAVYAAPTTSVTGVDPLVSLSVLGTQQSRAAVCASASAGCGVASMPATSAATTAASAAAVAAQDQPPPKGFGVWPVLLGVAALIAVIVAITSGGDNGHGDLTPISPA